MTNKVHYPQKKQEAFNRAFSDRCTRGFILEHAVKIRGVKPGGYGEGRLVC